MSSKLKFAYDETETGIAFRISEEANQALEKSAQKAERAKKREAKLRLEDHLKRFPDWTL
ncbi:TraY domain-containing protein [Vibrio mediterranei]|uniref:TraY domain-containing protein n=1 Tax=Vibrio mediterranei TaxID=689 RepID=UPI00148BB4E5|nr:TraY domain-containing protein [Vibrio mediterranei]NOI26371.1 TraY domain-containing protein [Vibrio mediterranei]